MEKLATNLDKEDLGILLAMVLVAWSDKSLTASELELIKDEMHDQGLDEQELALVHKALMEPPDIETITSYLVTPESKRAALTAAYATALADESLAMTELDTIRRLASALAIPDDEHEQIRAFAEGQAQLARQGEWQQALFLEHFVDR